jgi:hypothetical protein
MIKIQNTDVYGFDAAIRGARNPMNSWHLSDSYWTHIEDAETLETAKFEFFIGENDHKLLRNLANAGPDHGKYLRMITVTVDVTAPLYWWKEADQYRISTVTNSCSTMHKIHAKPFTLEDFSHENMTCDAVAILNLIIEHLNQRRCDFLESGRKIYWWDLIQLLPSSYNQRRTYFLNYAVLKAMYHARKNHKLDEWHVFCDWIKTLPYSELITGEDTHNET